MSAWIVDDGHIDVLIAAAREYLGEAKLPGAARALGQALWRENHRSVNYRYGERTRTPRYTPHLSDERGPLHPVAVLKAIGCYEYQTCEHPEWEASAARRFTQRLEAAILAANPELAVQMPARYGGGGTEPAYYHHPVYEAAPWGYTDVKQALAAAFEDGAA